MLPKESSLEETLLDRLLQTAPGLEIWWDSSPLVYPGWREKIISSVPDSRQAVLARQLNRLYDPQNPVATLFTGVTTNPPLSYQVIQDDPQPWSAWIRAYTQNHPDQEPFHVGWNLYKEIVKQGAERFLPVYTATDYAYGHLSAQVNPYTFFDADAMFEQALELRRLAPNIAIKIPGTKEGVGVIRKLTALGVPTNCTSGYTVPQFIAVAEAVQDGLQEARKKGIDLTGWRSVVTHMSARWESATEFTDQAEQAGIPLSIEDRRWASIVLFKRAYQIFRQRAYPSKMLICSLRMGPVVDGVTHCWHLEETAGANTIFTLPPPFLTELFMQGQHLTFEPRIRRNIPPEVMQRLQRIPYFSTAYDPKGLTPEDFNSLPPLLNTWKEFKAAMDKIVAFTTDVMQKDQTSRPSIVASPLSS